MHVRTRASCRGTSLLACENRLRKHPFLLALRRWSPLGTDIPPSETSPASEERGETVVFAGYPTASQLIFPGVISAVPSLEEQSGFRLEYLHFLLLKFDFFILCSEESSWLEAEAHWLLLTVMHLEKHSTGHVAEVIPSIPYCLCCA